MGVIIGSGIGGLGSLEEQHKKALEKGFDRLSPFFILQMIINMAPGLVTIKYGCKGPNWSPVSACSTSAHAIGEAVKSIRSGETDAMIAGGSEAAITPLGIGGFAAMKALSTRNDDPARASRPFDKDRDGFVEGEGAGIVVLEEMEHARRRGANILAEVVGYGANSDAHHVTAPAPEGEGAARCMRLALGDAGMRPEDVGYLNAHGTSTPFNDANETRAIKTVFGPHARKMAISSTKSMTGHMLGRGGRGGGGGGGAGAHPRGDPADHQLHHAGSGLRSGLRAEHTARDPRGRGDEQQLRVRWNERGAAAQAVQQVAAAPGSATQRDVRFVTRPARWPHCPRVEAPAA